ncbi:uncharacterized protein LOC121693498 isoform X1 [Alosa sapidissima]|uniref:uncharacterized protein LOC121693498 isoform X1 n=3 Tax=Alosa sapidissima TaxID=34773 RepID=UPI001C0A2CBC|nr:uncharacterized protein LOC121693498 isoform X1 [Alosa sapidissima]
MLWIYFLGLFLVVNPFEEAVLEPLTLPVVFTERTMDQGNYVFTINSWTIENLSLIVEANHGGHIFVEGKNATLRCETSSKHHFVAWSWERSEGEGVWEKVDTGKQLVLSRAEDNGNYRCHGYSKTLNASSLAYEVYFLSTSSSVLEIQGVTRLAAAALVLSLLALLFLAVLVLWLWVHRIKEASSLTTRTAEPNDYGSKNPHSPPVDDGDIYMNSLEIEKAYSDLNPTFRAEDQSYATLA